MKARHMIAGLVLAAAVPVCSASASAQQGKPALYAFHTDSLGSCPGLDWHVVVTPAGAISGFVAWDHMKHMATLSGSIAKDRVFALKAQEVGGAGRTARVMGTAGGDYIHVSIEGSGTSCDKQPLEIPRVVGGEGGGG